MRVVKQYNSDLLNGFWIGTVVGKIDRSAVRVRIHGIDSFATAADDCYSAVVGYPTTGGQLGSGSLSHNLQVGSWVYGVFVDDQLYQQPIVLGVISGGRGSGSGRNVQLTSEKFNSGDGEVSVPSDIDLTGNNNVEKAYNFFVSMLLANNIDSQFVHMLSSAFVGVLMLESGVNLNPVIVNRTSGAYGIAQWLSRDRIVRTGGQRLLPADAGGGAFPDTLSGQLSYIAVELRGRENAAYRKWINARSLADAVAGASVYERAEEWVSDGRGNYFIDRNHPNFRNRLRYAQTVMSTYTYSPPTNSVGTSIQRSVVLEG